MSLTKVFDALTDGILVINQSGEVSYFNQAASQLINGTSIDTLGIDRLGEMMRLVLNEQISLPFTFKARVKASNHEYQATVSKLYSFYIVALSHQSSQPDSPQNTTPSNVFDYKGNFVHDLLINEIMMFSNFYTSKTPASENAVLDAIHLHQQKLSLFLRAIFLPPPREAISLVEMLRNFDSDNIAVILSKALELNIYGVSEADSPPIFCHSEWLEIILADCLNHSIFDSKLKFDLVTRFDQDLHYITLFITHATEAVTPIHLSQVFNKKLIGKNTSVNDSFGLKVAHDIPLARLLIEKLRGYITIQDHPHSTGILIKLPIGPALQDENNILLQQSRLFAQELGELKLKIEEATNS